MELFREQLLMMVSVPLILGAILLEIIVTHFHGIRAYTWRETRTNFCMAALNGSMDLLLRAVLVLPLLLWCWQHRIMDWEKEGWAYWLLLFLVQDLAYYALHYVDHHCRLFWAVHVTHHSSEEFNLTTGFRSSVFQPLYRTFYFMPIAWMGFEPLDILFMYAATQIYGSLIHTERVRSLGWLEYILVTPSHHRVHHASNGRYLDKNMGMCLIIWDRLFGTYQEELAEEPVRYGLTKRIEDRRLSNMVFHEWRDIWSDVKNSRLPWLQRLGYVWMGPGWRGDEPAGRPEPEKETAAAAAAPGAQPSCGSSTGMPSSIG